MSEPSPRGFVHRLTVDGRERWRAIHLPSDPSERPRPCVLALHGATSNPRLMERFCGLSDKADAAGFVVGYPAGTGALANVLTWNGGGCCGHALHHDVDDVAFFHALLDDLIRTLPVDPRRVFVAGMSNGAHMAYRLAVEMPERLAAIACVAGPMSFIGVTPTRPVPVLHIHGSDDEFAPFAGGRGARSLYGITMPPVAETIATWVRVNGCPETPQVEVMPDGAGDGTHIVRSRYGPGREGAEVVLVKVEGGGHTWPGRPPLPLALGKSTANLNANDEIWAFFERHARA